MVEGTGCAEGLCTIAGFSKFDGGILCGCLLWDGDTDGLGYVAGFLNSVDGTTDGTEGYLVTDAGLPKSKGGR